MHEEKRPLGIFCAAISARIASSPKRSQRANIWAKCRPEKQCMSSRSASSRSRSKLLVFRFSKQLPVAEMGEQSVGIGDLREPLAASRQRPAEDGLRLAQARLSGRNNDQLKGRQLAEQRQVAPQVSSERAANFVPRIDVAEGWRFGPGTGGDVEAIEEKRGVEEAPPRPRNILAGSAS